MLERRRRLQRGMRRTSARVAADEGEASGGGGAGGSGARLRVWLGCSCHGCSGSSRGEDERAKSESTPEAGSTSGEAASFSTSSSSIATSGLDEVEKNTEKMLSLSACKQKNVGPHGYTSLQGHLSFRSFPSSNKNKNKRIVCFYPLIFIAKASKSCCR